MDANFQFNNPFPSAQQSQHLVDNPSPSINSDVAPTCVHIREEDSHCEQCRQQIRSMSRSMLQQSPQFALTPSRQSIDPFATGANSSRQRRRASHFPSASDSSMSSLFPSSPEDTTTSPVPTHPWRESKRRDSPASRSLTNILHSSRNASTHSRLSQSSCVS